MYILITGIMVSFVGVYLTALSILYSLYSNARYKIEESCKHDRGDYKYIPTEEQVKIIEYMLQLMKNGKIPPGDRMKHYDINVNRYKLITKALSMLTLGKFKHVV